MLYETVEFENSVTIFPPHNNFKYHFDAPYTGQASLESGQRTCRSNFTLPKGTKIVYIAYMFQYQLYHDVGKNKNCELIFSFPKNLVKVVVKLDGSVIIWPQGLTGISSSANSSTSLEAMAFHQYLRERHWTDLSFVDFFPPTGSSYKHAIPLDLSQFNLRDNSVLTIESEFNDTLSPTETYCIAQSVIERVVHKKGSVWSIS